MPTSATDRTPGGEAADGRSARRRANRQRVLDAMLELVDEHGLEPTVDEVVARSGVSERSLFRHFDGLDDLRAAVIARNVERVEPLMTVEQIGEGSQRERVARLVETRLRVGEALAPISRVGRRNAALRPIVAAEIARFRSQLEEQVRRQLAPELAGRTRAQADDLVVAVAVLLSVEGWDLMATAHGRTRTQVRRAWTRAVTAMVAS